MVLFIGENAVMRYVAAVGVNRSAELIFGMLLMEPPHIVPDLSFADNKINWTIGYRRDSDIWYPYRQIKDRTTREIPLKFRDPDDEDRNSVANANMVALVENKTKMVAWFVSNCARVQSSRMELAQELNKYIPVDIYGKCGPLKCDRSDSKKCYEMLDTDYKFYLSFENALCDDYITEKTFDVMKRNIIPVIYSAAPLKELLPPMSYINAEDYDTPKELADYLNFLANNPVEYMQYFWWKEYYYVWSNDWRCPICQKLNEQRESDKRTWYTSLEEWYKKDTCRLPKINLERDSDN